MIEKKQEQHTTLNMSMVLNCVHVLHVMEAVIMTATTHLTALPAMEQEKNATKVIKLLLHKD